MMKLELFENVVTDSTSKYTKIKKEDYLSEGQFPIIDQGQEFIGGYTNDENLINKISDEVIIFGDHTKVFKLIDFPIAIGADGVKVLQFNTQISYPRYVYYYFRKIKLTDAGYSRHFKFLKEVKIPLPPLSDQIRIAEILSQAESLIAQRKQSISLLDELLKSTFLEMFGDIRTNSNKFPEDQLAEKLEIITYGLTVRPEYISEGIPLISAREIRGGKLEYINSPKISLSDFEKLSDKAKPKKNDILFSKTGSIGHCALVDSDQVFAITQNAARLTFKKDINPVYALYYLRNPYIQKLANISAKGNAVRDLQLGDFKKFNFITPPLELQAKFAATVEKVEALKTLYQQSLSELQNMYGVLSQKAFKGELNIKEVKVEQLKPKKCTEINKAILAGHIINSTNSEDFGRVKFQKLLYLTEHVCKLNLGSNYLQNVAGPYDGVLIKEVESTLKRLRFYDIGRSQTGKQINYIALGAATQLGKYFSDNFEAEREEIDKLLNKFKKSSWEQTEIVATLYAVWNNRILKQEPITDELLKIDFFAWDPQKKKYKDRLDAALAWMRDKGVVPEGWGKVISKE